MKYTVSDPFPIFNYNEILNYDADESELVALEISDVIDFHDYHDAPDTIYISLNRKQLEKFISDLTEKLKMMK